MAPMCAEDKYHQVKFFLKSNDSFLSFLKFYLLGVFFSLVVVFLFIFNVVSAAINAVRGMTMVCVGVASVASSKLILVIFLAIYSNLFAAALSVNAAAALQRVGWSSTSSCGLAAATK